MERGRLDHHKIRALFRSDSSATTGGTILATLLFQFIPGRLSMRYGWLNLYYVFVFATIPLHADLPVTATIAPQHALPVDLGSRPEGDDWPCFLGPTRDSRSAETGILTRWPAEGLPIVWHRKLGISYDIGTVSRGRFFQFDRHGNMARLTCLQSETGEELWRFEYSTGYQDMLGYNNGPRCSPVVDGDRVYLFGPSGMLHCLLAVDGQTLWKIDTEQEFGVIQNFFGVGSTPVIEEDLLIVNIGGSPPEDQQFGRFNLDRVGGDRSGIVAFNKYTGAVVYSVTDELASYASPQLATINGRRWCFVFARGGLVGLDPSSGVVDFHYPWRATVHDSVNASTPVVVGDEVLISETYGPGASLLKIKPGQAEVVWSDQKRRANRSMATHWNTAVHHEGYLYGSSGRHSNNAELRCIDWKTGAVQWSVPRLTRSSLLYADGHFICLTEAGDLLLLRATPEQFEAVATVQMKDPEAPSNPLLEYPAWAAPILSHGLLYVRGKDRLVCLELIPQ
jgi:outer membrane protein assembly factor BamB